MDRVADTASLVSIFAKHPAIAPYVQNLLFASSDEQAKRYLDDLTQMGFGQLGLLLAGIYKPRRTRAMNAASGNGAKPNPNIHPSQGNTNIPTNPGNGLPNTATAPGNITTSGNNPGNPANALNPGAVTPGNNIGNQPLNPGNQLANPNNSLTPGQQATTPNSSQTPLQNIKRTLYSIHDIPSIHDTTPVLRRPLPNYTEQELEIFRNHTSDWHTNFDWPFEVQDFVGGHGGNHVYETPKAIADRILNPQPGARIPTASSRTFDPNSADYFVKETLRHNSNIIDSWLLTSTPNKGLELKYIPPSGELTGFGIPRGGTNFMPTYKMTVWVVRTQNGYILDKHYPSFK